MKRAELIIGKTYYKSDSSNWRDNWRAGTSYHKTAMENKYRKVTIVETQLKTEYEKEWRTRDVLIRNHEGKEIWVPLTHIRCEWSTAIQLLTTDYRTRISYRDDRGQKYAEHLRRKHSREVYTPALKLFMSTLEQMTDERVWGHDRIEHGFSIEQLNLMNQALSLLKTEKKVEA